MKEMTGKEMKRIIDTSAIDTDQGNFSNISAEN